MRYIVLGGYFCLFLILGACAGDISHHQMEGNTSTTDLMGKGLPILEDLRESIGLQSVFSSSAALGFSVESLFDDNPSTYWQTKLGLGPRSYLHLVFLDQGVPVSDLLLAPLEGDQQANIREVNIYVNDSLRTYGGITDTFKIDTIVKRLTIELMQVGEMSRKQFESDNEKVTIEKFPADSRVGLAYLTLFDTTSSEYKILPPQRAEGRLASSSNLNPLSVYHAGHLFDYKQEFAWVEGAEGSGSGDSILFQFNQRVCINKFILWNGFQADLEQYESNARIRSLSFKPLHDTSQIVFQLQDVLQPNTVLLTPKEAQSWVLKILDIYPGKVTRDLAISEILLF